MANSNDAYIPEVWAAESLMILQNNMVAANLVHRDFSNEVANFGDVVNTRKPANFAVKRKTDDDAVTVQNASSTNVGVKLDQHLHTSFRIKDGEESKGFKYLVGVYLQPALISIAQGVDEIVMGMVYQYLANNAGQLGAGATKAGIIEARNVLNNNQTPADGRTLIISSNSEADLLGISDFVTADKVGDEGTALREGSLGRKFGFEIFMDQNTPSVALGNTTVTGAINKAAGYAVGTTVLVVDGLSAAITNGTWLQIAGDDIPQRVTATAGGSTPIGITISPGLRRAVVDDAVITLYTPGAVNDAANVAAGISAPITVDGFSVAAQKGQLAAFGTATDVYSLLSTPTTTSVDLNRATQAALTDDDKMNIGPKGEYNFFFYRNALSLVTRPLALPAAGTGAKAAIQNFDDLSIRVTITYDGVNQGHLVTVDMLLGVEVLDSALGGVLFA